MRNKILIIEDDKVLRESLSEYLKDNNYDVITSDDGNQGLLLAASSNPEIILLDLNLPGIYGLTIMEKIREEMGQWGKKAKIIILTNQNTDDTILASVDKYHPSFYLMKSNIIPSQILSKIEELIKEWN